MRHGDFRAVPRDRRRRTRPSGSSRGQSLVEFALVLPRAPPAGALRARFRPHLHGPGSPFNGMARIGANYAAQHPEAWTTPGDPAARAEYLSLMTAKPRAPSTVPSLATGEPVVPGRANWSASPLETGVGVRFQGSPAPLISVIVGIRFACPRRHRSRSRMGCLCWLPTATRGRARPRHRSVTVGTSPTMVGLSVEGAEAGLGPGRVPGGQHPRSPWARCRPIPCRRQRFLLLPTARRATPARRSSPRRSRSRSRHRLRRTRRPASRSRTSSG